MKTTLIFIGLKIVEITGLSIIVYLIALIGHYWKYDNGLYRLDTIIGFKNAFIVGIGTMAILIILAIVLALIFMAILKNWELAKKWAGEDG